MKRMKIFLAALMLTMPTFTAGCSGASSESRVFSEKSDTTAASSVTAETVATTAYVTEPTTENVPDGTPTIFVGLDGKAVYSSEITTIEESTKKPEEITSEDVGLLVKCDGFIYLKKPNGIAFDSYHSPELFENYEFCGEFPTNTNSWTNVKVGEKFCGLTLTKAVSAFTVSPYEEQNFPEKHYNSDGSSCEFEGSVTVEGFLTIRPRTPYETDGGGIVFTPTQNVLPIKNVVCEDDIGCDSVHGIIAPWSTKSVFVYSEDASGDIQADKTFYDAGIDFGGLNIGDTALVQAVISNIKYGEGSAFVHIDSIKVLSDVIYHAKDSV